MKKPSSSGDTIPSFREWLASLSDEQLSELLSLRPDTVLPLPPGISSLAARLQLRASISRALRSLNTIDLLALEAAASIGGEFTPVTAPEVVSLIEDRTQQHGDSCPPAAEIAESLDRLRSFGLIFGAEHFLVLQEAMSALPTGWQLLPDAAATPADLAEQLSSLSARSKKILVTLAQSGGTGVTKDAAVDADPTRPIPQLIAKGLLHRVDEGTVQLPQAVHNQLSGRLRPPLSVPSVRSQGQVLQDEADQSGTSAGLEVCRTLRLLLQELGAAPVSTLKGGAIGVRMTSRLAKALSISEVEVARLMCLGVSAGLISRGVPEPLPDDDDGGDYYAPTPLADQWLGSSLAEQLHGLLAGWRDSVWAPWQLGTSQNGAKVHLLASHMRETHLPEWRELLIDSLGQLPLGGSVPGIRELLSFHHPLAAAAIPEHTVQELLDEAVWIGAVSGGVLTSAIRLGTLTVPPPVEQLIVQADMTMLAPGPLTPKVQQFVDVLAELESSGLASVYRITESSVRRALDSGLSASEIMHQLTELSLTPLPQSIGYLVDDVARKHGSLRGGPAMSYLRCDDPALIIQAVEAVGDLLALRAIAPTVAIAQAPLITVIKALRAKGFQPTAEDALGASLNLAPVPARVPQPPEAQPKASLDHSRIEAAVHAIRRGETARDAVATGTRAPASETLSVLQAAARAGKTVTLGFVDKQGVAVHRVVRPVTVAAGLVDAIDTTTGSVYRFQVHRITEVLVQ
ncbi:helicase-associated domain-containing protein [Corynebacterium sp. H128]|uniref:helicase-associated domain-containing protein n=1 Tax=Corynebacterium sp. H128 TaxID=3133427 RepID=UPI0030A3FA36